MNALKSKTINFALLLAALGAAQANLPMVQAFVTPEVYGYLTLAIAVVVAVLRAITTKPLSEK
jgi:hypothetical protein